MTSDFSNSVRTNWGSSSLLNFAGTLQLRVRRAQVRERTQDHHHDIGQVVAPEDRHLFQHVVQRFAALKLLEEVFEQFAVVGERTLRTRHVILEVVAFGQLGVERAYQLRIPRPVQLAGRRIVVHRVAVGDYADDLVVDEFGVGVEVFVCRQFFLLGQLLTLFGVTGDFHGQDQYLEVEVVGLVDGRHQRFLGRNHVVCTRFEVREQHFDDLNTK